MFDAIFPLKKSPMTSAERSRLRQTVRLSLLLHDLGHAPGSHASECAMPLLSELGLCSLLGESDRQATHEDYTLKLLLESDLGEVIKNQFGSAGIEALDIAHLISGCFPSRGHKFIVGGVDYYPLLSQLVSGEMDADRMDYLQRDSFFTGVAYGNFDQTWLLENLGYHVEGDKAFLAIVDRAIFAFEDFAQSIPHVCQRLPSLHFSGN